MPGNPYRKYADFAQVVIDRGDRRVDAGRYPAAPLEATTSKLDIRLYLSFPTFLILTPVSTGI